MQTKPVYLETVDELLSVTGKYVRFPTGNNC